jgi:hypothetical protein
MSVWRTNWFWAASLDFNLFLFFLKLLMNMRLATSFARVQISYFLDPRFKSYRCCEVKLTPWVSKDLY